MKVIKIWLVIMLVLITVIVCQTNNLVKLVRTRMRSMSSDMDMEYNTGPMVLIMRGSGPIIKLKDKAHSGMLKEMYIEVNSKMIWQMVLENILTLMGVSIKENLKMTCKKVMEKRNGSTVPNM